MYLDNTVQLDSTYFYPIKYDINSKHHKTQLIVFNYQLLRLHTCLVWSKQSFPNQYQQVGCFYTEGDFHHWIIIECWKLVIPLTLILTPSRTANGCTEYHLLFLLSSFNNLHRRSWCKYFIFYILVNIGKTKHFMFSHKSIPVLQIFSTNSGYFCSICFGHNIYYSLNASFEWWIIKYSISAGNTISRGKTLLINQIIITTIQSQSVWK